MVSEHLQVDLVHWLEWLAKTYPPWVEIWLMMACCIFALHKSSRVHSVGIGKIIHRLLSNCVLLATGTTET